MTNVARRYRGWLLGGAAVGIPMALLLFFTERSLTGSPGDEAGSRWTLSPAIAVADQTSIEAGAPPPSFTARRPPPPELDVRQVQGFEARLTKTVIELQPFRESTTVRATNHDGRLGSATLTNLNPSQNAWYLLRVEWEGENIVHSYHLENAAPENLSLHLDQGFPQGIILSSADGSEPCPVWADGPDSLHRARDSKATWAPVCGRRLFLRNPTTGRKTSKEWVTDFLRDHVWRGEQITVFVREKFFQDAYIATSEIISPDPRHGPRKRAAGAPARPRIDPRFDDAKLTTGDLGIHLENPDPGRVFVGRWYPARDNPGVFASTVQPKLVAPEVFEEVKGLVNPLEPVEEAALVFMIAFDLEEFDLGFALGTEHPRVVWSDRVPASSRNNLLPGPDGIGTTDPLVMTGMVSPAVAGNVTATFTAGFKRTHGAFRSSDLAHRNSGSHYGFIEHGTVLSKLQPGLATVIVWDDGSVELTTWTASGIEGLERIRHARQNGVPIIDYDGATGTSRPGDLVRQWSLGNWSGSQDKRFRTLRAGLCQQASESGNFLIYGYFSSATPSAMARIFQAYGCRYAMLLDMNALEHTYLAIYRQRAGQFLIQHLVRGMEVLDKSTDGHDLPRFIGFADNRDFFYLMRRGA